MVEAARRLAAACNIPIFADADTGYGNAVNVYHTVKEFIRAGVAGVHIEDQEAPKKSGTLAGRRLISREEAIGKYKAAVAAKNEIDPEFVICARCDSIGSEGGNFEEAIQRCIGYVKEAGVDAIWVNTLQSREEIREACRRIPAPVIAPYYGPRLSPTFEEFQDLVRLGVLIPERLQDKRIGDRPVREDQANAPRPLKAEAARLDQAPEIVERDVEDLPPVDALPQRYRFHGR